MADRHADTASLGRSNKAKRPPARPGVIILFQGDSGLTSEAHAIESPAVVGRGDEADVWLDDSSASRVHARLSVVDGGLWVEDTGSTHGVRIDGKPARASKVALAAGTLVRLGNSLLIAVDDVTKHQAVDSGDGLVGGAFARRCIEFAERFAGGDPHHAPLSILLLGETGTGKEVVAHHIHHRSGCGGPLVSVNCAALPKDLVESQLFGHKRGAFSGAVADQSGHFVRADGGTLFLDEVGELDAAVQAKLLRVLETKEVLPIGASDTMRVDVRIIAATCQELRQRVDSGTFREDLFHRLSGVTLWLPPLRERSEEIPLLVAHFLSDMSLSADALEQLMLQRWRGNVRELRHVLQAARVRARAQGRTQIDIEDCALDSGDDEAVSKAPSLKQVVAALKEHAGNVSRAARALGAHRAQLYRILEEHGLSGNDFRS